jgi:hypothetical protein
MLKTLSKDTLPRGLSYPLGLSDLERTLGNIPQASALQVRFRSCPIRSAQQFRAVVARELPHTVIAARFVRWDKKPGIGDEFAEYLRGQWSVHIYPVASARRAQAHPVLIDRLSAVAAWFSRKRAASWYHGRKSCVVVFNPLEVSVRVDEVVEAL